MKKSFKFNNGSWVHTLREIMTDRNRSLLFQCTYFRFTNYYFWDD
jgi:hypothetical protein